MTEVATITPTTVKAKVSAKSNAIQILEIQKIKNTLKVIILGIFWR